MPLSPVTRRRLDKFRKLRRAHVSFWVLLVTYGLSLFADLIANNQPLAVRYGGKMFFPVLFFYSGNHWEMSKDDILKIIRGCRYNFFDRNILF